MSTYRLNDGQYLGTVGDVAETSKLERALKEFNSYYERLTDVRFGAAIGRLAGTADGNALNQEYGRELARAESTKRRIESVLGAWDSVKGAIGLAALPLIPVAITIGLTAAVAAAVQTGLHFMRRADIAIALERDPNLTYEQARDQVEATSQGTFGKALDVAQLGLYAAIAFLAYQFLRE